MAYVAPLTLKRFFVLMPVGLTATFAAAQYTATLLHPAGYPTSAINGVGDGAQIGETKVGTHQHAMLWHGSAASAIDLNPVGFSYSTGWGTDGSFQVGYGDTGSSAKALLWSGTASSAIDLTPPSVGGALAFGVRNGVQVGYVLVGSNDHAYLWHGSAASAIDIHPAGYSSSRAWAVSDASQVGYVVTGGNTHAAMWTGSAASVVDLHPIGFTNSQALGASISSQGGFASGPTTGNNLHAFLWSGSAATGIDLHPSAYTKSLVQGLSSDFQVGIGSGASTSGNNHALVWTSTAESALDLQQFLTGLSYGGNPLTFDLSEARGVDSNGNVFGRARDTAGNYYAMMWSPIRTISGIVGLQNLSASPAGLPVTVELRAPGSTIPLQSHDVALDGSGNFSFTTSLAKGTYDIAVKASHWLREVRVNQAVGYFGISSLNYSLVNGDVNGDNAVTLGDFAQLRSSFGSGPGDPNWNPNADLNGDGAITLGDFAILRAHFGQQGDP